MIGEEAGDAAGTGGRDRPALPGSECKVMADPLARCEPVIVAKAEVDERTPSPVSLMPKGLLNRLSQEEILDLMAYLMAKGDRQHPVYATKP